MNGSTITIRPTRHEDEEFAIGIYNLTNHDVPPMSLQSYREWVTNRAEGERLERFVAVLDGTVVGSYDLREAVWIQRPNTWFAYFEVDPAHRHRGIGSQLFDHVMAVAANVQAARIYGEVREDLPDALAFVEHRGCRRTGRMDRMSRLDVRAANLSSFEGVDERVRAGGIEIRTLAEIGSDDEDFLRRLHSLEAVSMQSMPRSEEVTPEPYAQWAQRVLHGDGRPPECFWIALDGAEPVGTARLMLRGERAAFNGYTGVHPNYRGRGIAKALKLHSVAWARDNEIDFMYTGNDTENHPMLAINIPLGYEALPPHIEVVKEIADES